jgi:hypothetical protein
MAIRSAQHSNFILNANLSTLRLYITLEPKTTTITSLDHNQTPLPADDRIGPNILRNDKLNEGIEMRINVIHFRFI